MKSMRDYRSNWCLRDNLTRGIQTARVREKYGRSAEAYYTRIRTLVSELTEAGDNPDELAKWQEVLEVWDREMPGLREELAAKAAID